MSLEDKNSCCWVRGKEDGEAEASGRCARETWSSTFNATVADFQHLPSLEALLPDMQIIFDLIHQYSLKITKVFYLFFSIFCQKYCCFLPVARTRSLA